MAAKRAPAKAPAKKRAPAQKATQRKAGAKQPTTPAKKARRRGGVPQLRSVPDLPVERPSSWATDGPVPAPAELDVEALEVWAALGEDLHRNDRLTLVDVPAFAVLCTAIVHHRRAVRVVNENGILVQRAGGNEGVAKNPALQVVRDQAAIIATYSARFGLTPRDRLALKGEDDDASDHGWLDIVPSA